MEALVDAAGAGRSPAFNVPQVIAKELSRHIEDQIIFGELPPGTRLIEEDIVKRYKVSRSPVREALRALEQEGLAVRESRRGVWVSDMSLDDLDDVYACRLSLEGLATEMAAEKRDGDDVAGIRAAIDALEQAMRAGDLRGFFRFNIALTTSIHVAAHNRTLQRLLSTIGKQSYRYRFLAYSRRPDMMRASVDGHREVLLAIEKQNKKYARTLVEDLINQSWRSIQQFLRDGGQTGSLRA